MKITPVSLKDCYIVEPDLFEDERGYFYESFNRIKFMERTNIDFEIVQENHSKSKKGVLRGLHFQVDQYAQAKLIRCLFGEVLDVVVDLRKSSPTFGQHYKEVLSAANKKQLYVPKGFAHGFLILSDFAEFFYGVDHGYAPKFERGLMFNDPYFNIDWSTPSDNIILSDRDRKWPPFNLNHNYFD